MRLHAQWTTLLLALLAFSWQSFIVETHLHASKSGPVAASAGHADAHAHARAKTGQPPSDLPDSCPLCQEQASAGDYLLPTAIAFPAPEAGAVWFAATPTLALALHQRSHAWRSRAPPRPFQA